MALKKTFPNLVPQKVNAQILKFKKDYGYTYSGMLKTLIYFYEIKILLVSLHNTTKHKYG